jgi:hypothetical protein
MLRFFIRDTGSVLIAINKRKHLAEKMFWPNLITKMALMNTIFYQDGYDKWMRCHHHYQLQQ